MKLYDFTPAPNPRRVRIFLAEKGIEVPMVQVDIREMEQFGEDFRKINPYSVVPVLELDDGTRIGESVAICRYFEEVQPAPPLMGIDAADKAVVEMWNRRAELMGIGAMGDVARNALPMFEDRALPGSRGVPQIPALAERGRAAAERFFRAFDAQLADHEFVAGPRFTIADITAWIAVFLRGRVEISAPDDCTNLKRWYEAVEARPSTKA